MPALLNKAYRASCVLVDLISDALPFGPLWYDTPDHAIGYAMHYSRSADSVIRVCGGAGNVIETHHYVGDLKEP